MDDMMHKRFKAVVNEDWFKSYTILGSLPYPLPFLLPFTPVLASHYIIYPPHPHSFHHKLIQPPSPLSLPFPIHIQMDPETSTANPDTSTTNPQTSTANPETSTANPEVSTANPETGTANPDTSTANPDDATDSTPPEDKPQPGQLSNWLPITASRKAKWWYSAFHNVTAMVGAGVLGLPFALSQLGWIPGIVAIVASWLITFYSLWQLVELHESVPGRRFDRYPELGMHVFGPKLGYWTIMPLQLTVQVASTIVYTVTGGKSLKKSCDLLFPTAFNNIRQTYFILFFTIVQLVMSQSPNFNSLKGVSLLAAVMSFGYSMVACVASLIKGNHDHHANKVRYGVRSHSTGGRTFDALNGIGTIAFAFAGHSVALEIQATIPSTEETPSKIPMWRGVSVAYAIVACCYISVSISGYWAFGISVEDDVLVSLEKPNWLIAGANFMVFLHVIGSYQVFAMPVFDTLESALVQKYEFKPSRTLRLIARSSFVALVGFVGMCIPFFGGLLGFFGGLVFSATSYFVPCIMWLVIKRPKPWSFHWIASWTSTIVGLLIAVLTPIGGLRQIVISFKTYKIFS